MPDHPGYAIIGRGAWASKMRSILESEQRRVTCIARARREPAESEQSYTERLASSLAESRAQIVWLCVPPGPHVRCMMKAAICAGVHAIAEKPWLCSPGQTESLIAEAHGKGIRLGVHFEYCLLDEIEAWRERFPDSQGLRFGGRFAISRPDRLGVPAELNLGCHLLAIRRYAAPQSELIEISCAYNAPDERRVWIDSETVDFTQNRQPVIQRFIQRFEAAIVGADFPFGIDFARRVTEDVLNYRAPQTAASHPR
jgi:predicted dehydrogenase